MAAGLTGDAEAGSLTGRLSTALGTSFSTRTGHRGSGGQQAQGGNREASPACANPPYRPDPTLARAPMPAEEALWRQGRAESASRSSVDGIPRGDGGCLASGLHWPHPLSGQLQSVPSSACRKDLEHASVDDRGPHSSTVGWLVYAHVLDRVQTVTSPACARQITVVVSDVLQVRCRRPRCLRPTSLMQAVRLRRARDSILSACPGSPYIPCQYPSIACIVQELCHP